LASWPSKTNMPLIGSAASSERRGFAGGGSPTPARIQPPIG
jgi:hypothetical protein